jgi:hypothetical protein
MSIQEILSLISKLWIQQSVELQVKTQATTEFADQITHPGMVMKTGRTMTKQTEVPGENVCLKMY